jgi:hypothetical protein
VGPWGDTQARPGHPGSACETAGGGEEGRGPAEKCQKGRHLSSPEVSRTVGLDLNPWSPPILPVPLKSVFKNYDPEGRGTISQEDFERLSGNFPFACHGLHPPPRQG